MIVQKLLGKDFAVGYNAMYDRIEDLIEVGAGQRVRFRRLLGWRGGNEG